ncbi:MAG: porin [Cognatishimia sp.]
MKKVLFASTALVMAAGVAAAEVKVTGGAKMGLKYNGATTSTTVHNDIDFNIVGSGETDGGIAFGASVDLDAEHNNSANSTTSVTPAGTISGKTILDPEVFVSYNGLKLTIGDIGEATDVGLDDIGVFGIGVDDAAEKGNNAASGLGSHDVRVDYAFADFTVALTADSSNNDFAIGFGGSLDAFTFNIAMGETGGASVVNAKAGYSAGAIGVDVLYRDTGTGESYGVRGNYTTGDLTLIAQYGKNDVNDAYGIGVAYDLGGATLAGAVGEVSGNTMADLGISFNF